MAGGIAEGFQAGEVGEDKMTHQLPLPIFVTGQRVRVYELTFSGDPIPSFYAEGVIIKEDDMFKEIFDYKIDRMILPLSGEAPHSWKIGTVGQFNVNYPSVELII